MFLLPTLRSVALIASLITVSVHFVKAEQGMTGIITPIQTENVVIGDPVKVKLLSLGAPKQKVDAIASGIHLASTSTGLNKNLLIALIYTESSFQLTAVSSKGYKGLMQTPYATMIWADVDILVGAKILKEKLGYANGDLKEALALYKGGRNPVAREQAMHTFKLYKKLLTT